MRGQAILESQIQGTQNERRERELTTFETVVSFPILSYYTNLNRFSSPSSPQQFMTLILCQSTIPSVMHSTVELILCLRAMYIEYMA